MQPHLDNRIRFLDGLRALAVVLVIVHHAYRSGTDVSTAPLALVLGHVLLEGAHGVDLFFVLSGYCLAVPTLVRLRTQEHAIFDLPTYAVKRLVRLLPPYYAAIVVIACLIALLGMLGHRPPHATPQHGVSWQDVAKQVLFLDWYTVFLNGSFWSLAVEFRWYFFFPVALLLWVRAPRAFLFVAIASAIAFAFTRLHALDVGTLLPFMLGIVAADLHMRARHDGRLALALLPLTMLAGVALEAWVTMPSPDGGDTGGPFLQTNVGWQLAAFFLVVAVGDSPRLQRAFSSRALVAIGVASYSLYLIHEPIVDLVQERLPPSLPVLVRCAIALAAALLCGFAFWAGVERVVVADRFRASALERLRPIAARCLSALQVPPFIEFRSIHLRATADPAAQSPPASVKRARP